MLRTADVRAGFVIAGFHDRSETFHRHGTGKIQFLGAFLDQRIELVVVFFERDVIRYPRRTRRGWKGLAMKSTAPRSSPLASCSSFPIAVMKTTAMLLVRDRI